MTDLFISYARADRERIAPLAAALAAAGYDVWWDADLEPGSNFSKETEARLNAAKAVVVAWSAVSIQSMWVADEATVGRDKGNLVPISLDGSIPPIGFRQIHTTAFADWGNDPDTEPFQALSRALAHLTARPAPAPAPTARTKAASRPRWRRAAIGAALSAAILCVLVVAGLALRGSAGNYAAGVVAVEPFSVSPDEPERRARASSYVNAFRQRLTELGVANEVAGSGRPGRLSEIILSGEVVRDGDKDILTARLEDRRTAVALWSVRKEPSEGADWEANLTGFALKCALTRRDPQLGTAYFSRFLSACALGLQGEYQAEAAAAKALLETAPRDDGAMGLYARATITAGWAGSDSDAEYRRLVREGGQLAEEALTLNPKNADALFARVFSYSDYQFNEQEKALLAAISADPELGHALGRYGNFLNTVGRIDEAIDIRRRAEIYRSAGPSFYHRLLASRGDWRAARDEYNRVRSYNPDFVASEELQTEILYGDVEAAARTLAKRPALAGDRIRCWEHVLAVRQGESRAPARIVEDCGHGGHAVRLLARAGDLDGAFNELERFLLKKGLRFPPELFWPEMHEFRRDPRFWPLAASMGLVDYWLDTDQWPDFCAEPDLPFDCKSKAAAARLKVSRAG